MRVVAGSFAAMSAVLGILVIHNFPNWCGSLSAVCFFAFFRVRQPGESRWTYLTNPRAIVTLLSALTMAIMGIADIIRHLHS